MGPTNTGERDPDPERLVAYLRDRFGEDLRSCVVYETDDREVVHVRDDIDADIARARVDRVHHLYEGERAARSPDPRDPDLGPLYASTHVFGAAIVIHLLDETGTVVAFSLDHVVGGRLTGFVRDCMSVLYDQPPTEQ